MASLSRRRLGLLCVAAAMAALSAQACGSDEVVFGDAAGTGASSSRTGAGGGAGGGDGGSSGAGGDCLPLNYACSSDGDCCSGDCDAGQCGGCASTGEACAAGCCGG